MSGMGWKTMAAALGLFLTGTVEAWEAFQGGDDPMAGIQKILAALGLFGLRHAVAKKG